MPVKFEFLAWNIDQARREEAVPETKWDVRSPAVKHLIKKCDADIIALIELRDLETSKESARAFLSSPDFAKYDIVHRRYGDNPIAFSMALLVKHEKFMIGDVRVHQYHNNPANEKIVMFVDVKNKADQTWFTVGVTHLDLPEQSKWTSVHILRNLILAQRYPCFVYGDYNFFSDMEGDAQRGYMLEKLVDLAFPLEGVNGGTFVGFPHDDHKQSWEKPSRLDHIFAPQRGVVGKYATSPFIEEYKFDNTSYETYTYPSDHLALSLQIRIE